MRRGLMSWSEAEMPREVLQGRVRRLQQAMRARGLGAVLAYTSFARPAVVHWLCNFTPYWSEAMLVVPARGEPTLLASLTPRVHDWIRSMAHLGEVRSAPKLGDAAASFLGESLGPQGAAGVVGLDLLPASVAQPLVSSGHSLVDFSAEFRSLRQPADAFELSLARKALGLAGQALAEAPQDAADTSALARQMERSARLGGAEEVLIRVAPDLSQGSALLRLERPMELGSAWAVELALAYKGAWVRLGRSVARSGAVPGDWRDREAAFEAAMARLRPAQGTAPSAAGPLTDSACSWLLQASVDAHPLAAVALGDRLGAVDLPPGALAMLSCHATDAAGRGWFRCEPLQLLAEGGLRLQADTVPQRA